MIEVDNDVLDYLKDNSLDILIDIKLSCQG